MNDLVEWLDGVHLVGTPLWCDSRRTHDACFLSSARVVDAWRHRQLITTQATLALLPERVRHPRERGRTRRPLPRALAVPYGRPFNLGAARLELFPSGHVVGGASLAVELRGGARVVYAGVVNPRGDGLAGAAEVRSCDELVVDAHHGHRRLPPAAEARAAVRGFVERTLAAEATPVLLADPLGAGADLAAALGDAFPLRGPRAFADVMTRLRALGLALPEVRRLASLPRPGEVILWPPSARKSPALARLPRARVILVGPDAEDPAFALGDQADRDALLEYIAQTGARRVHLLHLTDEQIVRDLAARGVQARPLGPPAQLVLKALIET